MDQDVTIIAALVAGLISFLSPCVLPLVPPYIVYLTGATIEHIASEEPIAVSRHKGMAAALLFVLGFFTVIVALGASASLVGAVVQAYSAQLAIVAGIVIIVMGLHFLGLTRIGLLWPAPAPRSPAGCRSCRCATAPCACTTAAICAARGSTGPAPSASPTCSSGRAHGAARPLHAVVRGRGAGADRDRGTWSPARCWPAATARTTSARAPPPSRPCAASCAASTTR